MTAYSLDDRLQENRNVWKAYWETVTKDGVISAMIVVAIIIFVFGYLNQHMKLWNGDNWVTNILGDFYANASSEMLSIVITVAIVDRIYNRQAEHRELNRLKALLKCNESVVTKIAIAELRASGWLRDGSLEHVDLVDTNLEGGELYGVKLNKAFLIRANMKNASLVAAILQDAVLIKSKLENANLLGANLEGAVICEANLERVNLMTAKMRGVNLLRANLKCANLNGADLEGANLIDANLEGAIIRNVNFEKAQLGGAILPNGQPFQSGKLDSFTNSEHPEFINRIAEINEIRIREGYPPIIINDD